MKRIAILLSGILIFIQSFSQHSEIGIQAGLGSFEMTGFKNFNELVQKDLPFETKITADFPMHFVYKFFLHQTFKNNWGIGFRFSFSSTGSMVSREDYSGSYYFKNQVRNLSPGFIFDYTVHLTGKINMIIYNELGWEFSHSKMHENLSLSTFTPVDEVLEFRSVNLFTEPGIKVIYKFKDWFYGGLYLGYLWDTHSPVKSTDTAFQLRELYTFEHSKNAMNWTGIRFGITVSYRFPE